MSEQVAHLLDVVGSRVSIRVIAFSAGAHPGQLGGFAILHIPSDVVPDIVCIDSLTGQVMIEETNELVRYGHVFDEISKLALSVDESKLFLQRLAGSEGYD